MAGAGGFAQLPVPVDAQEISCQAPQIVCSAREAVFIISSFDPLASAVRIGPDLLVTNRHVTADQKTAMITTKTGTRIPGRIVATAYAGDLVLIKVENLPQGPVLPLAQADQNSILYTVGADASRRKIRVYPPGKVLLQPAEDVSFARLYHTALSQPGNSGGALVDQQGRLVGIVTSGGEGRFEAFPVSAVERLKTLSGAQYVQKSQEIGAALRACIDFQDATPRRGKLSQQMAQNLMEICGASNNRQLMDDAAVILGSSQHLKLSRRLLEQALERDPLAINTRLSLVAVLAFSRLHNDALPHIRQLLVVIPEDASLQRFAIQAGKFAGDKALAEQALALTKKHNPDRAEDAARFLAAPLRRSNRP